MADLYLDGKLIMKDATITTIDAVPCTYSEVIDCGRMTVAMFGTVSMERRSLSDARTLLSLLSGKNITNNWLRMHGGIVQRKRAIRKVRCNI